MRSMWKISFFFKDQAICALNFFHIRLSCAQLSPCFKDKKNPHPNWASYVKDTGSYIQATYATPSQIKQCQPKKNPMKTLGVWSFSMLFWPIW
jgi:hypothetical protein